MSTDVARLQTNLKRLSLHTIAAIFEREAQKAAKTKQSYAGFLSHLVDEELAAKSDRSVNARIARARFPVLKTLEQFQRELGLRSIPARRLGHGGHDARGASRRAAHSESRLSEHDEDLGQL
jgi:DNA replication protein DnaC